MEGSVFPDPAVAGVLAPNYVEARLHTDGGPRMEENRRLQVQMSDVAGNPVYVLYDPVAKKKVGEGAGYIFAKTFIELLKRPLTNR